MNETERKELFERARKGDPSILSHPEVARARGRYNKTPLHILAEHSTDMRILEHQEIASVRDCAEETPLHALASTIGYSKEIQPQDMEKLLAHPMLSKVCNDFGQTPLHDLAITNNPETLRHPDVATIRNINSETPLHILASYGNKMAKSLLKNLETRLERNVTT